MIGHRKHQGSSNGFDPATHFGDGVLQAPTNGGRLGPPAPDSATGATSSSTCADVHCKATAGKADDHDPRLEGMCDDRLTRGPAPAPRPGPSHGRVESGMIIQPNQSEMPIKHLLNPDANSADRQVEHG